MRSLLKAVLALVLAAASFAAGWAVRDLRSPLPGLLGMAVDELHRGSVRAQREYEQRQAGLHAKQVEAAREAAAYRRRAAGIERARAEIESRLVEALKRSDRAAAAAEAVPEPPSVAGGGNTVRLPENPGPCLDEIELAAQWEAVAGVRLIALDSMRAARGEALEAKRALTRQVVAERRYAEAAARERDLLAERFDLAERRVKKLSKGRVKWWAATAAGVAAGFYLGGRR